MKPATRPPETRSAVQLLSLETRSARSEITDLDALPELLVPGDVVVVNDAATLPGSIELETAAGDPVELRLLGVEARRARAVVFGAGSWRDRTEDRPPPPPLAEGDTLHRGDRVVATVGARDPRSDRLLEVHFRGDPWRAIYELGRPVQYSHLDDNLELWSVQTVYSSRPVAAEMPSAGRPLSWRLILAMRRRGIHVVALTHAAGLSATGDDDLDRLLPLPERYSIPERTAEIVRRAVANGDRVIAIGTTVARALESAARAGGGAVVSGDGCATLRIGPDTRLLVVSGILTGMHDVGQSHYELLAAFAEPGAIEAAWQRAADSGFRGHELGDVALIAPAPHRVDRAIPR